MKQIKQLKTFKPSRRQLTIFVAAAIVLGTGLTLYSKAATDYSLQSSIEAESLPISSSVGGVIADSTASAGKATAMYSDGTIKSSIFTTTDTTVKLEATARGTYCKGSPKIIVKVDNVQQGATTSIGSKEWKTYSASVSIPAGQHVVSVTYPNDRYVKGVCDRNLFVDKVAFYASSPLPGDVTAPTVNLTAPANGAVLSGATAISATATDNISVSKVEFYIDNVLTSTSLASPYGFTKNSADLSAGTHTIEARAYDPSGNVGTSKISVSTGSVVTTPPPTTQGLNKGYFLNATAFTNPITSPTIRTDSAAFMTQFKAGNFWNPNMTMRGYGVSIVKGTGQFTAYPLPPPGESSQYIGSAGKMQVPKVPAGTQPAGGTDGHLAVIVDSTVYEIYKATVSADGTITNAKAVARADLNGNGQTSQKDAPSNAAGLSLLAGIITPEELASGHIDHALVFSVPGIKAGPALFPAWENVAVSGANTVLVEGSRIQLDPSVDISKLPEPQKTIAKALQTYGAYLRDNGGTFSVYGETSNRWPASYGTANSLGIGSIPWASIRVIN